MKIQYFAEQLNAATDPKAAEIALERYLAAFGFRYFAFTYYAVHIKTGRKLRYDYASPALRPWHIHYLEQSYADVDRTLEENYQITAPLFWNVHEQLLDAKNIREKRIRDESIEFGIESGMSFPVHGPHRDFVCLTLHQCRGEQTLVNYQEKQYEWHAATLLFYHHIKRILDISSPENALKLLTKREAQCLKLTAEAWRVEQIAKTLNITVRTVNYHIQNANKKLGVNNKYHAAYKYFTV